MSLIISLPVPAAAFTHRGFPAASNFAKYMLDEVAKGADAVQVAQLPMLIVVAKLPPMYISPKALIATLCQENGDNRPVADLAHCSLPLLSYLTKNKELPVEVGSVMLPMVRGPDW